jgi:urease accessory protein
MDLLLWQLADSAFPTGAFTQSGGLEAAWQQREVTGIESLQTFLRCSAWQAGYSALPIVNAAHRAPSRLADLDSLMDVFLRNPVANRASRAQGQGFVSACARAFSSDAIRLLEADVRSGGLFAHLAPVFGVGLKGLDVPRRDAGRLFLYVTVRGVLSAAVRLAIVGPLHAQRMQADCHKDIEGVLERCGDLEDEDLAQASPLIDVFQGTHDRLYSRLFHS